MKQAVFSDKCAIITGGATWIGRATGKQLLTQGLASLAIIDGADPHGVCSQLRREFPQKHIVFVAADLSMRQNVRRAFELVRSHFGSDKIDLVIGCGSGVLSEPEASAAAVSDDKRKAAASMACGLIQTINVTYEAIDAMSLTARCRGGTIAHISPISSIHDICRVPPFYATSHAIVGLMRSLSHDHFHRKHGISFITFCPVVSTELDRRPKTSTQHQPHDPTQRIVIVENMHKIATIRSEMTGRWLVEAVATGKNNSVWVVHEERLREIQFPRHQNGLLLQAGKSDNKTKQITSK